ncbi:MAG: zinc-ribbon domain-containing protein [Clostridia bacterium]|nr:zinc-ribbon domain-containing protein [Clostridia bacterium]MBQ3462719.1 zinc-ribbon domain-containing protein [Clostridia bacterium]MBQ3471377.1 zinc-ribbon domain-containing protein [Clostridia bacterium]MBQ6530424.1 zinc-ribbon domain-containing protein [Clostridia bacterium]MBQ6558476.1 zinc-ribbon domain-containing protein [Clostridia bacterium]
MQYCKNCGRQLKDGMRFCDRCGQSVRKAQESGQAARHREINELREERLNRRKRLAEKEERQIRAKENKRKKNGKNIAIYILVILLIAVASVLIGFLLAGGSNSSTTSKNSSQTATTKPYSTPVVTEAPAAAGTFSEITVGNVRCPYPSGFHSGTVSGNEKMNLTDPLGGAKMIIAQEAKGGDPIDLAKAYSNSVGASTPDDMRKGDDWYSVTATVNGTVHHRKSIIRNGLSVYYDFEYEKSSGSASTYEGFIEEIDKNFK